jgi:hypothetical protein
MDAYWSASDTDDEFPAADPLGRHDLITGPDVGESVRLPKPWTSILVGDLSLMSIRRQRLHFI